MAKRTQSNKQKKLAVYDPAQIEKKWQKKWAASKIYASKETGAKDKYYVLDMFPYPSGEGLHVGHPKGYIATDVISRMKRMQGKNVLHPMGFDAFGLPAENYAIKTKTNPEISVKQNVARFKKQLEIIGLDYDWSREVVTTDPDYYKWTQWIFLQMWKKGLAYESYEPVNWCPTDKTVLANEDVENGRCERCGTPVEKKPLRQWLLKITDYADRLLKDLDGIDTSKLPHIIDKKWPPREGKNVVGRRTIHGLVRDPKTGKFLGLKWKKYPWVTFIVGGVENGENVVDAAKREILEETGYSDLKFIKVLGGPVKAEYFAAHKDQNRIAITSGILFELNSDKRIEQTKEAHEDFDVIWMEPKDMNAEVMTCAELPVWLTRLTVNIEPVAQEPGTLCFVDITSESGYKQNMPLIERNALAAIVKHWSEDKYIGLKWKKVDWQTVITGAPEENQTPKEGAIAEIIEETGFLHPKFVKNLGRVHSKFFHIPKKVNRFAHFDVMYFELADGDKRELSEEEQANHEVVWLTKEEMLDFISPAAQKHMWNTLFLGKPSWFAESKPLLDWPESIKEAQRNWIGRSEGALINFTIKSHDKKPNSSKASTSHISVFTTRPDTLFGVTYVVLAPEHKLVKELLPSVVNKAEVEAYISRSARETEIERTDVSKEKTGVELKGVKVVNPVNNEEVPVWIADYVLADYGTGAVMAVPAHDDRDWDFAKKFKLPIRNVIVPVFGKPNTAASYVDGVAIVPFDPERQLYGCLHWGDYNKYVFISGSRNPGESYEDTAKRELAEEAGFKDVKSWYKLGEIIYSNYYNSNKKAWKSASSSQFVAIVDSNSEVHPNREAHETFEVIWKNAEEILELFNKTIPDSKHMNEILARAVHKLKELKLDTTTDISKFDYIKSVPFVDHGALINSGKFNGKTSDLILKEITAFAGGQWVTKYKLRDWVFSRQRYWGEPIPLIHCEKCGVVPVPEKDLPVKLPRVKSYEPTGTGESPLAAISKWVNVKCPNCKGPGKRETNTMPQWAGSCWYYLRYVDPKNKKSLVDPKKEKYWSPVDLYVGGAEHATRHLIYARFWHKFLNEIGVVSTTEPFTKLQSVGLIMGEDGRKMSKRFGNVVNPDNVVKTYGADTLRLYEMFMGPFDQSISWSTKSMIGPRRFIERVWKMRDSYGINDNKNTDNILQKTIKKVTDDISDMRFNTAISSLMIALNEIEKLPTPISRGQFMIYLQLLAPFAPHVTEELWTTLGNKKSIHISPWPTYDPALIVMEVITIAIQINGKTRGSFTAETALNNEELENLAKANPVTKKWLEGKQIKRIIVVPGKLINIVTA